MLQQTLARHVAGLPVGALEKYAQRFAGIDLAQAQTERCVWLRILAKRKYRLAAPETGGHVVKPARV
jgi:hypothetical protein